MALRCFLLNSALMLGLSGAVRVGLSEELEDIAPPGDLNISSFLETGHDIELWPDQTVYYQFTSDVDEDEEYDEIQLLEKAMYMWSSRTCIKFERAERRCGVADTGPECFPVFISMAEKPTKSNLGYHANFNRGMNLKKKGLTLGTVLRELGHTIGLRYELERKDYYQYVVENIENVDESKRAFFGKDSKSKDTKALEYYDLGSIMHFGEFEFSDNPGIPGSETLTIKAKDEFGNCRVGQHSELSVGDILTVNKLYGCSADKYCADTWSRCTPSMCDTEVGPKRCPQTCGLCTCKDTSPGCEDFAKSGDCGYDHEKAKACAKSCGLCEPSKLTCIDTAGKFGDAEGAMFTCEDALKTTQENDHRLGCDRAWFQQKCPWTCGSCPAKPFCF